MDDISRPNTKQFFTTRFDTTDKFRDDNFHTIESRRHGGPSLYLHPFSSHEDRRVVVDPAGFCFDASRRGYPRDESVAILPCHEARAFFDEFAQRHKCASPSCLTSPWASRDLPQAALLESWQDTHLQHPYCYTEDLAAAPADIGMFQPICYDFVPPVRASHSEKPEHSAAGKDCLSGTDPVTYTYDGNGDHLDNLWTPSPDSQTMVLTEVNHIQPSRDLATDNACTHPGCFEDALLTSAFPVPTAWTSECQDTSRSTCGHTTPAPIASVSAMSDSNCHESSTCGRIDPVTYVDPTAKEDPDPFTDLEGVPWYLTSDWLESFRELSSLNI